MSELTDSEYFVARACEARELGEAASDPRAATAHLELALRYEIRANELRMRPIASLIRDL